MADHDEVLFANTDRMGDNTGGGAVGDALRYAQAYRDGVKVKADRTKKQADLLFILIITATALAPPLILLSSSPFVSKYLPALLTVLTGIASGRMQVRKPDQRWLLYRTAQRKAELEIDQFRFSNGAYNVPETKSLSEKPESSASGGCLSPQEGSPSRGQG